MRRSCLSVLVLLSCTSLGGQAPLPLAEVRFAVEPAFVVSAEVADEPAERAAGLMFRKRLGATEGMLFVFDGPAAPRPFFMKDTLIPLDLISILDGRVVGVQSMEPCTSTVCVTTTTPEADVALEVPAGTAARAGIQPGVRADYRLSVSP